MMALGQLTSQQFFAQLYAHTDVDAEPASEPVQLFEGLERDDIIQVILSDSTQTILLELPGLSDSAIRLPRRVTELSCRCQTATSVRAG